MNFVCVVFELGDKMLTLSSMENLIVPCNPLCSPSGVTSLPKVCVDVTVRRSFNFEIW